MTDGQETPSARRGQRPSAPHLDGPLGSSGAAPADEPAVTDDTDDRATKITDAKASTDATAPAADTPDKPAEPVTTANSDGAPKSGPESSAEKSSPDKASAEKPSADKASADKASADKASADKASAEKPSAEKPSAEKPSAEKSSAEKSSAEKSSADKASAEKDGPEKTGKDGIDGKPAVPAAASKSRTTRVLRAANPVRVARNTARSTSAWAKRPSGRLIVPTVIAALLLGAAGSAGAYLVPQALQSVPSPSVTPGFGQDAGASAGPVAAPSISGVPGLPGSVSTPGGTLPPTAPPLGGVGTARPADVLAAWAQEAGTRAGIPVVAVQAYGYAELVVARATPSCHLSWTTVAAIAKVESSHGSANGAVLSADGAVAPAIFGLPLDGKGGRQLIRDSDQGALDGDPQFDRAMGPLQFIPQTWTAISVGNGVDADNNGFSDPNDIDDAALAAARYLCQGGRDLSKPDAWWDAILSYNAVRPYAQKVFDAANEYGQRTRV
ncbi:murein transglycosylase [Actinoplanes sp. NPDC049668]|uniref:murein transglycosylase n=1 Tax=unclassified Actinoplanes TaxID=2626549 RepID=UPI0033AB3112